MRICILMGSPRMHGNTVALLQPFMNQLRTRGAEVEYITLFDKQITPCDACWTCQNVFDGYGCPKKDDMHEIFNSVLKADCFVLATPIYSWYCTPPMKAMLDRFYGMNKYYGDTVGPCLWKGKKCAIVTTCGYEIEYGAGPFEEGIKRLCEHSKLEYIGKIGARDGDTDDKLAFQTDEIVSAATEFGDKVYNACIK